MVDFMYYGEVNVSTEQLPQILKTAEMLKIKGLAEMPDAVTKSDSKSSDHTEGNQSISGVESMWGSTESQQQQLQIQQQQQQYHQIRRTPSPSCMSPATRRKRLRKSSTGSGSANISTSTERIHDDVQVHHQQQQQQIIDGRMIQKYSQQQSVDVPLSSFSVTPNVRGMKMNSSPDGQMQHHQQESHDHHIDESQHITEMVSDSDCLHRLRWTCFWLDVYFLENGGFELCKSINAIGHLVRNIINACQLSSFNTSATQWWVSLCQVFSLSLWLCASLFVRQLLHWMTSGLLVQ